MPTDLSAIDLATLNAVQGLIVAALRNQCCQWEQQSSDAANEGHLSNELGIRCRPACQQGQR
jgi:hypothetical protein